MDRHQFLGLLEEDYYQRVAAEYGDEIGIFGRINSPKFQLEDGKSNQLMTISDTESTDKLDQYLPNTMEKYIFDDKTITEEIDQEISRITLEEKEELSKGKNLKD